ncbi:MAG TPA: hypothetical protein VFT14_03735 [Solirubrobacterales bacterium]|nr:hypothetical protein [Solirubrobacterales bacterium]
MFFWVLTAGILGMYVYGLFLDIFGPLELGALSFIWTTTRERRGF